MSTARDLITLALKEAGVLGVGQTPLAEDINDGYTYLRRMMALWNKKRYMVPALIDLSFVGNGSKTLTVGPGGNFNYTKRPTQIKSAYFKQLNTGQFPVSMQLTPKFAYEDYAKIAVKDLITLPEIYFYDNSWAGGLGNVFFWPIPDANYEMHIIIQQDLLFPVAATGLDTVFTLPEEYEEPIHYNLAIRFCSGWKIQPQPSTVALAKKGMNVIKSNNVQIPEMEMPSGIRRGRAFNIFNPDGL